MDAFAPYTNENTPEFSLQGHQTYARVVNIYDGDTMTCVIPYLGAFFKFSVRLGGIDTCEMRSKHPINKELAYKARNRIISLVTRGRMTPTENTTKTDIEMFLNSQVFLVHLTCQKSDKYGRILVDVRQEPFDLFTFSNILIQERLAYAYQGDTKLTEEEQRNMLMVQ